MTDLTTFIIPTIGRDTLDRAILSTHQAFATRLVEKDSHRLGEGEIRNSLIKKATTEWLSMLDDDDTVTADYVERLQEEIKNNSDADIIHFRQYFIDTGQVFPAWPEVVWGNVGICFSVKREVALELPFRTEPHEDLKFIERAQDAGKKIVFSKYIVYRVRH